MATKIQIVVEGVNQAGATLKSVNADLAAVGATAAQTNAQLVPTTQAVSQLVPAVARLPAAAVAAAGGMGNLNKSLVASRQGMQAVRQLGAVLGFQMFPQLTGAVLGASSSINALRLVGQSAGVSLGRLAGIAGVVGLGLWQGKKAWDSYREAIEGAQKAQQAAMDIQDRLHISIRREIDLMQQSGKISVQKAEELRSGLFRESAPRIARELRALREAGGAPNLELRPSDQIADNEFLRKLQLDLLEGGDRELEQIHREHEANLEIIEQMVDKGELYGKQIKAAIDLNEAVTVERMNRVISAELADEQVKLEKELAEQTAKREAHERAIADHVAASVRAQRQLAQLRSGITERGLGRTLNDPLATIEEVTQAQMALEDMTFDAHIARLDELQISDEEYWITAEELAREHSENITAIIQGQRDAERQIHQQRLGAAGEMFGAMAQLARQFGVEGFIAYKALAISEAIVATYLGASKALADGDSYSAAFRAAAIIAMGLANVATIVAQQPQGFALGGVVPGQYTGRDDRTIRVGAGEVILTPRQVARIGPDLVYGTLAATGGRMPWNAPLARPAEIAGFNTGGLVGPAVAPNMNVQFIERGDRQDARDWQSRRNMRTIVKEINRRGGRLGGSA